MNELKIIDSHCHLWERATGRYPWLEYTENPFLGDISKLQCDYLIENYQEDMKDFSIEKFVHVEAVVPGFEKDELHWLLDLSKKTDLVGGIISGIDLFKPDSIELMQLYADTPLVKGVRHMIAWSKKNANYQLCGRPNALTDEAWKKQFSLLSQYELLFDMLICPGQMADAAALANQNENTMIIVEHAGFPIEGELDEWERGLERLASCPNVFMKLSGFGMFDREWTVASLREKLLKLIDCFGTDRCLFASNFPVDKLYSSFGKLMSAYLEITKDFSYDEKKQVYHDNAKRVYRL